MNQTGAEQGKWGIYKWIISYLYPYRLKMVVIILCGLVAAAGELVVPQIIGRLIDRIIPDQDQGAFVRMLVYMVLVYMAVIVFQMVRNTLQNLIGLYASRDLQSQAIGHLRLLGFAHYEKSSVGETLSLMNQQVQSAERIFRDLFPSVIQTFLFLIATVGFLLTKSILLTALIVPFALIYYAVGPKIDREVSRAARETAEDRVQFNKKVYESVSGAREIRSIGSESWDIARNHKLFRTVTKSLLRWVLFIHMRHSIRSASFQLGSIGMFVAGYFLIRGSWLTVGEFITFLIMYMIFMQRMTSLISQLIEQDGLLNQTLPLYKLFMMKPEVVETSEPIALGHMKGELEFREVHFTYPGRDPVLKGLSMHIKAGERIALVGKSGNGKSTILKLVNRFYDPSQGTILLDGVSIDRLSFHELRESIGFVFQETYLFGKSIRDNIKFGNPQASEREIEQAARDANAHDFISALPGGYDTIVGERGIKLSGGQKQRIAIARMFIRSPKLILLDEATSALDNVSENLVREALQRLLSGRTTITVAHRLSTVMDYDRILLLDNGSIAEAGTYSELMRKQGLFFTLAQGEWAQTGLEKVEKLEGIEEGKTTVVR